jgi:hypothetical protein
MRTKTTSPPAMNARASIPKQLLLFKLGYAAHSTLHRGRRQGIGARSKYVRLQPLKALIVV